MDIQAIQQGLADAASVLSGVTGWPTIPGAIIPPAFAVVEFEANYDMTFTNSMVELLFTCGIYVPHSDEGRVSLVGYLARDGSQSVKVCLETDRTLSGAAKTLNVERVRGAYRLYDIGGIEYLGAVFDVRVWA